MAMTASATNAALGPPIASPMHASWHRRHRGIRRRTDPGIVPGCAIITHGRAGVCGRRLVSRPDRLHRLARERRRRPGGRRVGPHGASQHAGRADDQAPPTTAGTTSTGVAVSTTLTDWTCPRARRPAPGATGSTCPADWSDPSSSRISLPVTVLPANAPTPRDDPIVVRRWPWRPGLTVAGTGASRRSGGTGTSCSTTSGGRPGRAQPRVPRSGTRPSSPTCSGTSRSISSAAIVAALAACRQRLERPGSTSTTTTPRPASATSTPSVTHSATTPGTCSASATAPGSRWRRCVRPPNTVRSVVLDSIYDVTARRDRPDGDRRRAGLPAAGRPLRGGSGLRRAHPDVAATITAVNERYNAAPIVVDVDLEDGADLRRFVITGDGAIGGLFNALYDADVVPLLPSILDGLANGETGVVPELIRRGVASLRRSRTPCRVSVNCADNAEGSTNQWTRRPSAIPGGLHAPRHRRRLFEVAGRARIGHVQRAGRLGHPGSRPRRLVRPVTPPAAVEAVPATSPTPRSACGPTGSRRDRRALRHHRRAGVPGRSDRCGGPVLPCQRARPRLRLTSQAPGLEPDSEQE